MEATEETEPYAGSGVLTARGAAAGRGAGKATEAETAGAADVDTL
jgi:hypothetical protein